MSSIEGDNYWTTTMRRRLSRRRLLQLGGVGVAGAYLAACAPQKEQTKSDSGSGASLPKAPSYSKIPGVSDLLTKYDYRNIPKSTKKPVAGGTMIGDAPDPPHFDFVAAQITGMQGAAVRIYNLLVRIKLGPTANNLKKEIEGDLAERWEVAKDGSSYTFYLRKDVRWQNKPPVNGREFTAEDVRYALEVYKTKSIISSYFRDVDKIEAPDKYTVRITMKEPTAHFLTSLAGPFAFIFPRENYEAGGIKENPVGTGPFMLREWKPKVTLVLEKNPNYWKKDANGSQLPYLDRIEMPVFPDIGTQKAAFRTGQKDIYGVYTPEEIDEILKTNPKTVIQILPQAPSVQWYISPQVNKKPFDDIRVRRAMSLAIDRQDNIDTAFGGAAVPSNFVPFDALGLDWPQSLDQLGQYMQYDPKKAKELLAEAGFPNGFKTKIATSLTSGSNLTSLLLAQQNLKAIGIDAELDTMQSTAFNEIWRGGKWDQLLYENVSSTGFDVDNYTYDIYKSDEPNNYWHWNDPEFDKLLIKQRRTIDAAERQKLAWDIFKYLTDRVPRIGTSSYWRIHMWQPWIQGYAEHLYAWAPWHGAGVMEQTWIDPDLKK